MGEDRYLPCFAEASATALVFSTDFNTGATPQFSSVTTTESVQGYSTVADFSGSFLLSPFLSPFLFPQLHALHR